MAEREMVAVEELGARSVGGWRSGSGEALGAGDDVLALLDSVCSGFERGEPSSELWRLTRELDQLRRSSDREEWNRMIEDQVRGHPVLEWVHQDPLTRRAFEKPRGYAGDAAMLDYIYYGQRALPGATSRFGRALYAAVHSAVSTTAVRHRRIVLAGAIDEVAGARPGARVLSVACGHLREAELSTALQIGAVGELIAYDQDAESLSVVTADYPHWPIRPVEGTVRELLGGKRIFEGLDLVYSAGLYDYLPQPLARRLTSRLFESLGPGGKLLVANFHPDLSDVGYMEAVMDWRLVYRGESEMLDLAASLPAELASSIEIRRCPSGAVVYLTMTRAKCLARRFAK